MLIKNERINNRKKLSIKSIKPNIRI